MKDTQTITTSSASTSLKSYAYIKFIVLSALFTAIVFVATYAVQIPLPGIATGGLMHLGNVALFSIAIIFGKRYGAISGAFGMMLFDLLSPWAIWAPGTFIIRGVMGYLVGTLSNSNGRNGKSLLWNIIAMILPSIWMLAGYFGYNLLLYSDLPAAIASIPGDVVQTVAGIVITLPIIISMNASGLTSTLKRMATVSR